MSRPPPPSQHQQLAPQSLGLAPGLAARQASTLEAYLKANEQKRT